MPIGRCTAGWKTPCSCRFGRTSRRSFLWLLGGAFRLFGVSEASARWVNIAASTLLIPVTAATARRLWGRRAALTAAAVLALSPYAIGFAPTAYTDPVLVLAGMSAICAAVYGRGLPTGVLLGAAVMTKQQGVFYTPLVIGLLWLDEVRQRLIQGRGCAVCVVCGGRGAGDAADPVLGQPALGGGAVAVGFECAQLCVVGAAGSGAIGRRGPRCGDRCCGIWVRAGRRGRRWRRCCWAAWRLHAGGPLKLPISLHTTRRIIAKVPRTGGPFLRGWVSSTVRRYKARFASRDVAILLIAGWSVVLVAAHVTTTVQPWDRYLLPLAPMLALAAGWAVAKLGRMRVQRGQMAAVGAAGVLLLISPGAGGGTGRSGGGRRPRRLCRD